MKDTKSLILGFVAGVIIPTLYSGLVRYSIIYDSATLSWFIIPIISGFIAGLIAKGVKRGVLVGFAAVFITSFVEYYSSTCNGTFFCLPTIILILAIGFGLLGLIGGAVGGFLRRVVSS